MRSQIRNAQSRARDAMPLIASLFAIVALGACSSTADIAAPYTALPVVRAFLYAGEPVNDVRLTWTTTLAADDSTGTPINDAQVILIRGATRYTLTKAAGDSGYYEYAGSDLVVREGDTFGLEAHVGDLTLTASTIVPVRPGTVTESTDTLKVPDFSTFTFGTRPDFSASTMTLRWAGVSGALYFVTVQNLEADPVAIADTTGQFRFGPRRMVFAPTPADTFAINGLALSYLGNHLARVYRVNEEYAQLYATRQQDSRDLNEPSTNVHGGLGVFSAFASDTTRFVAVRP
jgi:Domain of unknown function (DUF4249)